MILSRPLSLLMATAVTTATVASAAEMTGYLMDNQCINNICKDPITGTIKTDGCAPDGSNTYLSPESHTGWCLLLGVCETSGYALMSADPDSTTGEHSVILNMTGPEAHDAVVKYIKDTSQGLEQKLGTITKLNFPLVTVAYDDADFSGASDGEVPQVVVATIQDPWVGNADAPWNKGATTNFVCAAASDASIDWGNMCFRSDIFVTKDDVKDHIVIEAGGCPDHENMSGGMDKALPDDMPASTAVAGTGAGGGCACNPCASNACNPCAAKPACAACNPCAAKAPCAACAACTATAKAPCVSNACAACTATAKAPCASNACAACTATAKAPCASNACAAITAKPCAATSNPCGIRGLEEVNPCAATSAAEPCVAKVADVCAAEPCVAKVDACAPDPCATKVDPCATDPCATDPCATDPCATDPCANKLDTPGVYEPTHQHYTMRIPAKPAVTTTATPITDNVVGVMTNGVLLDTHQATWAYDSCNGHSDQQHQYHYHIPPVCFLKSLGIATPDASWWMNDDKDAVRDHDDMAAQWPATSPFSPLVGYARDGHPMYAVYDKDGKIQRSKMYGGDLDECNGKDDGRGYAYYLTAEHPFVPTCMMGKMGTFAYASTDKVCPRAGIFNTVGTLTSPTASTPTAPTPASPTPEESSATAKAFVGAFLAVAAGAVAQV